MLLPANDEPLNILVTGGYGFIGFHLVNELLDRGHNVRVLDDFSTGQKSRLPPHPRLKRQVGSVLDAASVKTIAADCDLCFHLASVVGMLAVAKSPSHSCAVSRVGTQNVLEAMRDKPVVLFSSSCVYGLAREESLSEEFDIHYDDCMAYDGDVPGYAVGKYELDRLGQARAASHIPTLVIRPFNVVGRGQAGTYGMVLPNFVYNAINGLALTVYDDGLQSRCFSSVEKFIEVIFVLLGYKQAWQPDFSVFNVGSDQSVTILALAQQVYAEANNAGIDVTRQIVFEPYSTRFPGKKDVRKRIPDTTRIEGLVGTIDWPSIEAIVAHQVRLSLQPMANARA